MLILFLSGCAILLQGSVGATGSPLPPGDANVTLQADLGASPAVAGEVLEEGTVGFGLSARSRIDDEGQMNDVGVHVYVVNGLEVVRPFARTTLFALAAYDTDLTLQGPGLGVRLEGGTLICPGGEDMAFYCLVMQGTAEYDGWFGASRSPFWIGGSLGIAINWNEEP